jgi:hypothetical protein
MKMNITNTGIRITKKEIDNRALRRSETANQNNPRKFYVYAHEDMSGQIFYIGKGTGMRAWSKDRHPLWHRYVNNHLANEYKIIILEDNLSSDESEELEGEWITHFGSSLVNWVNYGRETDFDALERFHKLRNTNKKLISEAKKIELEDLSKAILMYCNAIKAIQSYINIDYEKGLVGKLLREERNEIGLFGEIEALDRLTVCLIKLKRVKDAAQQMASYFKLYKGDLNGVVARRIQKRIGKALDKNQN